jgi:hypothetical protein
MSLVPHVVYIMFTSPLLFMCLWYLMLSIFFLRHPYCQYVSGASCCLYFFTSPLLSICLWCFMLSIICLSHPYCSCVSGASCCLYLVYVTPTVHMFLVPHAVYIFFTSPLLFMCLWCLMLSIFCLRHPYCSCVSVVSCCLYFVYVPPTVHASLVSHAVYILFTSLLLFMRLWCLMMPTFCLRHPYCSCTSGDS